MNKSKLEYLWLDGYKPTQSLRGKTKIVEDFSGKLEDCPMWSFDGSSTRQAEGGSSDCLLKPVAIYPDPVRRNGFIVMTEVLNADGSPHESNGRATIDDDDNDFWFGFEQEYFLWDPETNLPLGFPKDQTPQGQFYCSVGGKNTFGREVMDRHLDICLDAGINVEGTNAEVAAGQWEFQTFAKGAKKAGDEMWVARYLLERLAEEYGLAIEYHPKPLGATDWNGSGMHANFSNTLLRTCGSPITTLLDPKRSGRLRADLKDWLSEAGIDGTRPIITHCHSHHRSGLSYLAGRLLGWPIRAYAGSWGEWGNHPTTPITEGPLPHG